MKNVRIDRKTIFISIVIIALFAIVLTAEFIMDSRQTGALAEGSLYVQFIDVGQGDSALITTPNGKHILIDAGTADSELDLLEHLDDTAVNSIDYMLLTHPHADHIGGAAAVIEKYDVKRVVLPDAYSSTRTYQKVLEAIQENDCEGIIAAPNDTYTLDDCRINILGPISVDEDNLNNASIVCRITYGDTSFMFTGDMESDYEEELIELYGDSLKSNVLKVGHHGSNTSSSSEFLDYCSPEIAVISCGKNNDYGHPHSEVIKRLKSKEIQYFRTDENGTVTIISDGKTAKIYEG